MSMIHVTLPDGTVNEYAAGITCSEVVTDTLGKKTRLHCGKGQRC